MIPATGNNENSLVAHKEAATTTAAPHDVVPDKGDASAEAAAAHAAPNTNATHHEPAATVGTTHAAYEQAAHDDSATLVRLAEGATAADATAALEAAGITPAAPIRDEDITAGYVRVALPAGTSVDEAVAAIAAADSPTIAAAQPDYVYRVLDAAGTAADLTSALRPTSARGNGEETLMGTLAVSVNDPYANQQWGLASLDAYEAWGLATGDSVTVAVLDAGFDIAHEDLAANVVAPYNAHTRTSTAADMAGHAHGTHVAGIVSAVSDNGRGVSGVSHNARVMPIKVADDSGNAYTSDLVRAYSYLVGRASTYNVRVVNISMGAPGAAAADDALLRAVDNAYDAGIVTVAAAGNATSNATIPYDNYPGDHGTIVSVMNLEQAGDGVALAASSNHNAAGETDKNICAPGTKIASTYPDNEYAYLTGTSMASPYVAGIMALEFAADPTLTPDAAKEALYTTATDLGAAGFDATYGYGEANARAAVAAVLARTQANDASTKAEDDEAARKAAEEEAARKAAEEEAARKAAEEEAARKAAEEEAARKAREDAQKVADVQALIDALPDASAVTAADASNIAAARKAYDALAAELRASVDATRLTEAEQALAQLEGQQRPSVAYAVRSSFFGLTFMGEDGANAGLPGNTLFSRLTALAVVVDGQQLPGNVQYRTYATRQGWKGWSSNGSWSTAQMGGIFAVQMRLTGQMAQRYDVCYRIYSRGTGWTAWVRNGRTAGRATTVGAYQLQALQVKLVDKGAQA